MASLYFITLNNKVFNTRINSRTCLIGLPDRTIAKRVKKKLDLENIEISEIDYMKDEFYEMLKLNQFTLMIANEVKFNNDNVEFDGDVIESPNVSREELALHFGKLYDMKNPEYF